MDPTNHGHGLEEEFPVGVFFGCNSINSFKDPRVKRWSKVGLVQHLALTPKPRHNKYVFVLDFIFKYTFIIEVCLFTQNLEHIYIIYIYTAYSWCMLLIQKSDTDFYQAAPF